jgi:hypothetical protein
MVVIPKYDGPYTVFVIGGDVRVFDTKVKLVRWLGGYREMQGNLCAVRPSNVAVWQKGYDENDPFAYRWPKVLVLNSWGEVLYLDAFREFAPEPIEWPRWWRRPGTRRAAYRNWLRYPRTQSERRLNGLVLTEDGETFARNKRANLPSSWDDFTRSSQRSWKEHRRNQYHH